MEQILLISSILLWVFVVFNFLLTLGLIRRGNAMQMQTGTPELEDALEVGTLAPDFVAEMLNGEKLTLDSYADQAVAFVFIAPDCPPCIEKIPSLNVLRPKAKRAGVELVLVNMSDKLKAETFVQEYDVRLPMLLAPENGNSFKEDYKVAGTPFFCLIDKEGKVQVTGYFGPTWHALTQKWAAT